MSVRVVTERKDTPEGTWFLEPGFHLLNMMNEIWLIDEKHPKFKESVETAIKIANTMGSKETAEKYIELLKNYNDSNSKY